MTLEREKIPGGLSSRIFSRLLFLLFLLFLVFSSFATISSQMESSGCKRGFLGFIYIRKLWELSAVLCFFDLSWSFSTGNSRKGRLSLSIFCF